MTIPSIPQEDITTIILSKDQLRELYEGQAMLYTYPKKKMLIITSEFRELNENDWPGYGTIIKTIGGGKGVFITEND